MAYKANLSLGDNPSNEELTDALDTLMGQGTVFAEADTDGGAWAATVARFINNLGPDESDRYGRMRWERVSSVAAQEHIVVA